MAFDNVTKLPKTWLTDRICALLPERMHAACRALQVALGC